MITDLLPSCKRDLHDLELQLQELERGINPNVSINDINLNIDTLDKKFDDLERIIKNEPKAQKEDYRRRIMFLKTSHSHIKSSFDSLLKRKKYFNEKKQLFGNATIDIEGGIGVGLIEESSSLDRSSNLLNEYLSAGI